MLYDCFMSSPTPTAIDEFFAAEIPAAQEDLDLQVAKLATASPSWILSQTNKVARAKGYQDYLKVTFDAFKRADEDFGDDPFCATFRKMSHVAAVLVEQTGDSAYGTGARSALRQITTALNDTMTDLRRESRKAVAQ